MEQLTRPNGQAVRNSRRLLDLSQKELAVEAGLSQATISKVERGVPVRIYSLKALARTLAVEVQEITKDVIGAPYHIGVTKSLYDDLTARSAETGRSFVSLIEEAITWL